MDIAKVMRIPSGKIYDAIHQMKSRIAGTRRSGARKPVIIRIIWIEI
jgi:hypothetical protein